jgi:hypothetical protein
MPGGIRSEKSSNLLLHGLAVVLHNAINLSLLALLHLDEAGVDRVADAEAAHERLFDLADTEDAAEGLLLGGGVPPGVDHDHLGGHGQVETHYRGC